MSRSLDGLFTNIHGTEVVLERALQHGRRTMIASTSEVYGKGRGVTMGRCGRTRTAWSAPR